METDSVFELSNDGDGWKYFSAVWGRADNAFWGDVSNGRDQAFESRCMFAETAS